MFKGYLTHVEYPFPASSDNQRLAFLLGNPFHVGWERLGM